MRTAALFCEMAWKCRPPRLLTRLLAAHNAADLMFGLGLLQITLRNQRIT